jgi:hypothetical protein
MQVETTGPLVMDVLYHSALGSPSVDITGLLFTTRGYDDSTFIGLGGAATR